MKRKHWTPSTRRSPTRSGLCRQGNRPELSSGRKTASLPGRSSRRPDATAFSAWRYGEFGGGGVDDFRFNQALDEQVALAGVTGAGLGITLHNDTCLPYS